MNIIAIDLGKFNSMVCFYDSDTQEHSFWNAATEREYLKTVLTKNPCDLVVMEACTASPGAPGGQRSLPGIETQDACL